MAIDTASMDWNPKPGCHLLRKRLHRVGPQQSVQVMSILEDREGTLWIDDLALYVDGKPIAEAIRREGLDVSVFDGDSGDGPITLVYAVAPRRRTQRMLQTARSIDPDLLYVSEPAHESFSGIATRLRPVPHATGWRAVFKKK